MYVYDDVFGTDRGCYFLEPDGMLAYDPDTGKYYFCKREEKNIFLDRCQRSLECGRTCLQKSGENGKAMKKDVCINSISTDESWKKGNNETHAKLKYIYIC